MKITYNEKKYIQVRDVLFLAQIYQSPKLLNSYSKLINKGYLDTDFIMINNPLILKMAENKCLVSFNTYQYQDPLNIENYLLSIYHNLVSDSDKEAIINEYRAEQLRDILACKYHKLPYNLPLIPSKKINLSNNDNNLYFTSTIYDNYFLLQAPHNQPLKSYDQSFLQNAIQYVIEHQYPDYPDIPYQIITHSQYLIIKFQPPQVKHLNPLTNFIHKLNNKRNSP